MEEFVNKKLGDLEISKGLEKTNKDDLLVSYDSINLDTILEAEKKSTSPPN